MIFVFLEIINLTILVKTTTVELFLGLWLKDTNKIGFFSDSWEDNENLIFLGNNMAATPVSSRPYPFHSRSG